METFIPRARHTGCFPILSLVGIPAKKLDHSGVTMNFIAQTLFTRQFNTDSGVIMV